MEVMLLWLIGGIIFALLGSWISRQKNRREGEGLALGCMFGPIGAIIAALLPTLPEPLREPSKPRVEQEFPLLELSPEEKEAGRRDAEMMQARAIAKENQIRLKAKQDQEREAARLAAEFAYQQERDMLKARMKTERAELRSQEWAARRKQFENMPEGAKIALGVTLGVIAIVAIFVVVVWLFPK
jgi:hypothetical protein